MSEHPFGEAVPGEAVKPSSYGHHLQGYAPRGRYVHDSDGRWIRIDTIHAAIEREKTMTTTALAERPATTTFGRDQVELIKRTIAKGATDDELKLFMAQCERTGLDPFDRQIYFIKRKQKDKTTGQWVEVGQTQTSIDGFRVVAERTGEMDGQDVAWCDETGAWSDIWLKKTPPFAARVLVYRKGCARPFPGIARFDEYVQTYSDGKPSGLWGKMAANQIAKCAEALGLRKAFPKQLSGLYTRDEMGQAEIPEVDSRARVAGPQVASPRVDAAEGVGVNAQPGTVDLPAKSSPDTDATDLPDGFALIDDYKLDGDWHQVSWGRDAQGGWMTYKTKLAKVGLAAHNAYTERMPVKLHSNKFPYLDKVETLGITRDQIKASKFQHDDPGFCAGCGKPFDLCGCASF